MLLSAAKRPEKAGKSEQAKQKEASESAEVEFLKAQLAEISRLLRESQAKQQETDVKMLMNSSRPIFLKQRILSDVGHLSNEVASEYNP